MIRIGSREQSILRAVLRKTSGIRSTVDIIANALFLIPKLGFVDVAIVFALSLALLLTILERT